MMKCTNLALVACLMFLTGCVLPRVEGLYETMALPTVQTSADTEKALEGQQQAPVPPALPAEVVEKQQAEQVPLPESKRKFSLSLQDADLQEVLAMLSKESGVTIIARQGVSGKVSTNLENKTLGEILQAILTPLGLDTVVEGDMVMVESPRLVSRTFQINYINNRRESSSTTNASVSASSGTSTSSSSSSSSSTTTSSSGTSTSQGNVNVKTSGSTDFWKELEAGLKTIVFGGEAAKAPAGKQLVINEMAGVVYVTDSSDNMDNVSRYLAEVEEAVKRQVLIQAHIVEVTFDDRYAMGINWEQLLHHNSGKQWRFTQELSLSKEKFFQMELQPGDFTMLLEAMQKDGKVNMMSSPKISTLNNQKALIKLTTKAVTWVTSVIKSGQSGDVIESTTTPQIDEVGLFLDVTPSISGDGRVTLQIHPSISEIAEESLAPDLKSSKPIINVREVDTIADVKSGQTVVIAGLISDRYQTTRSSVPFLGDIPLLGNAFSYLGQQKTKAELVIFLTPFIMDGGSIERIRKEHEGRIERIRKIDHLSVLADREGEAS